MVFPSKRSFHPAAFSAAVSVLGSAATRRAPSKREQSPRVRSLGCIGSKLRERRVRPQGLSFGPELQRPRIPEARNQLRDPALRDSGNLEFRPAQLPSPALDSPPAILPHSSLTLSPIMGQQLNKYIKRKRRAA